MEYGPRIRQYVDARTTPSGYKRYIDGAYYDGSQDPPINWWELQNYMEDVVIENFRTRSKAGEIFNNPCYKREIETTYNFTSWSYGTTSRNYYFELYGSKGYLPLISDLPGDESVTNAINLAVTRAKAKVTSEAILLGATLGELRETRNMFISAASRLRHFGTYAHRYLDELSKSRSYWDKAGKLIGTASDAWMEMRFGWRPFVAEAQAFYKALQGLSNFAERQTFRAGENLHYENSDRVSWRQDSSMTWWFDRSVKEDHSIRAGVLCEQRYGGVPDTWGLTKIPSVVWELTRLSWAVDYFLNIGDLIAAYTPDTLWTPMASWVTIKSKREAKVSHNGFDAPLWSIYGDAPSRTTVTTEYRRLIDPTPTIAHKLPKFLADRAKLLDIACLTRTSATQWLKRAFTMKTKKGKV